MFSPKTVLNALGVRLHQLQRVGRDMTGRHHIDGQVVVTVDALVNRVGPANGVGQPRLEVRRT